MNKFATFNHELGTFADEMLFASPKVLRKVDFSISPLSTQHLNTQLRNLIPIDDLRSAGSFFTCDKLGLTALDYFIGNLRDATLILDPACGAGNLLIACSKKLPVKRNSLLDTLTAWGTKLAGFDIHKEFVEATKIRLILEAISRGATPDSRNIKQLKSMFSFIKVQDGLKKNSIFESASHIIINPPYCKMLLPETCAWGNGNINSAAVFLEKCIENSKKGTQIVAILPDVLRSGSRYEKWREFISYNAKINLKIIGRFDSKTDVDVFLLCGKIRAGQTTKSFWAEQTVSNNITIEDYFIVSTGQVVPYRDKEEGPTFCYISPSILTGQVDLHTNNITFKRQYSGTVAVPPFVVIRRTSSPSDVPRARGTIIRGNQPVAVENHLVILKPKSGYVRDCKKLLNVLANPITDDFLNIRIRCRHLTVSAIKNIPWIGEEI